MGKTADLTDFQKAVIDILYKERKPQKAIAGFKVLFQSILISLLKENCTQSHVS